MGKQKLDAKQWEVRTSRNITTRPGPVAESHKNQGVGDKRLCEPVSL